MSVQSKTNGTRQIAGAVIVAALLISASVFLASAFYSLRITRTTTVTEKNFELHEVTFNETGTCGPGPRTFVKSWEVTLGRSGKCDYSSAFKRDNPISS
jgi:hypothetical protein